MPTDADDGWPLRWHAWVAAGAATALIVVGLGVVALDVWLDQQANPPTCYGIGWGCTPDAVTTAVIVGFTVGVPAFAVAMLLVVLGWVLSKTRAAAGRVVMWSPAVLIVAVILFAVTATFAT